MSAIASIHAREILDSRGNPTVEVDLRLRDGSFGRAAVPSGASTGEREAVELRDGERERYGGKGVRKAVAHVNQTIGRELHGLEPVQAEIDRRLIELDDTPTKANLGANAMLGVSMALARAIAASRGRALYETLVAESAPLLPVPMFNVLNGGAHADNTVTLQEFMIAPVGAPTFAEALRYGAETYHALKALLKRRGLCTAVGDEGGFAPDLDADVAAIELILEAVAHAGLKPGKDVVLALDPAASEFYEGGLYVFRGGAVRTRTSEQMVDLYADWLRQFPIWSIEDGVAENDAKGWALISARLGAQVQLVGDDNFCTNPAIIRRAIAQNIASAALIKLNQIGTVTETLEAIAVAQAAGYGTVISHRSGETADDFIADLAVATAAAQIKTGAPARGERLAKYNQLLRIEEALGGAAQYAGRRFAAAGGFCAAKARGG
ncbi:phosphopyruvate hydratase [Fontimonas sp. SYSU GA230001]|uniref:phosphopyruvate hydratase n=1 Tax=Fontimonas sp. SYSU GA230001 TaxID=3142450 RepID=UPI0032B5A7AF